MPNYKMLLEIFMELNSIKSYISALGFTPKNGVHDVYHKIYGAFNYEIQIDLNTQQIIYPEPIRLGDKTTSNFKTSENFVVLECVDRLISHGYDPHYIELERNFPLGHKTKGKLDINVYNLDDTTFLMIECKTFGIEYDKAKNSTLKDGGQLLSYFQQDKSTHILCLYASILDADTHIKFHYDIIECTQSLKEASDTQSTFAIWNKQFKNNGIFEVNINPYNFKPKALRKIDLKPLEQGDSGIIFNGFMEILRHNVVSDKGNAFNKIFNLFLCKLNDEKRLDTEELDFQWKENDTYEVFLMRLNEIYANSVKDHLNKNIVNLTQKEIENLFNSKNENEAIRRIKEAILYKNNEFAFIDVFDEESFTENSFIVREVVELLQYYQIRYGKKQQFLGDFFEKLINTGFKQESGQFFTPVPLARFMINALPLQEITQKKLDNKEPDFLPYIIDYAMGTGHFLTEAMDQMQKIINSDTLIAKTTDTQKKLKLYQSSDYDFDWAKEFIYGLERDYRLVKTAKIACFFHGDGLANIIHGDGLDSFYNSKTYSGLLKLKRDTKDNLQFDIVVANPPYSVSAFKNTLKFGAESFDLFDTLTDTSSEIECLFVERTKQLLKKNGYASIILPSSILSNGKIHAKARHILLTYFDVYAICEFGANTFAATGTNTVVLFLKRRDDNLIFETKQAVILFFQNHLDVTVNHIEDPFSNYANDVHNMTLDEYIKHLKTLDITQEFDKLNLYLLNYKVQTLIVKSGDKDIEKKFLGYEFSNRRGSEGIKICVDDKNKPVNKLFNYDDLQDTTKVSSYVYQAGIGNFKKPIHQTLEDHLTYTKLNALVNFTSDKFLQEISLNVKKKSEVRGSRYEMLPLGKLIDVITPKYKVKTDEYLESGKYPIIDQSVLEIAGYTNNEAYINRIKETHIIFGDHTFSVKIIKDDFAQGADGIKILKPKDTILAKFLYELICGFCKKTLYTQRYQRHFTLLKSFPIPLPPIDIQKDMVERIKEIESEIAGLDVNFDVSICFNSINLELYNDKIRNHIIFNYGSALKSSDRKKGNVPVYGSNGIVGYHNKPLSHIPTVIIGRKGSVGKVHYSEKEFFAIDTTYYIELKDSSRNNIKFIYYFLSMGMLEQHRRGLGSGGLNREQAYDLVIPFPPLSIQQKIVNDIEIQRQIIADNQQKIYDLEQKKQSIINELWHDQ